MEKKRQPLEAKASYGSYSTRKVQTKDGADKRSFASDKRSAASDKRSAASGGGRPSEKGGKPAERNMSYKPRGKGEAHVWAMFMESVELNATNVAIQKDRK